MINTDAFTATEPSQTGLLRGPLVICCCQKQPCDFFTQDHSWRFAFCGQGLGSCSPVRASRSHALMLPGRFGLCRVRLLMFRGLGILASIRPGICLLQVYVVEVWFRESGRHSALAYLHGSDGRDPGKAAGRPQGE